MRRRSAAAVVAAVLAGLVPAMGTAHAVVPTARLGAAQAVELLQQRALVAAGVSRPMLAAATRALGRTPGPDATFSGIGAPSAVALDSVLEPAGDLTGDGVRDVIDVRYHSVGSAAERMAMFVRNGRTGALLWSKVVPGVTGHLVIPAPQRVGATGKPGIVLLDVGTTDNSKVLTVSVRLTALDRHGTRLWSHAEAGTLNDSTNAESHLPVPVDTGTFASAVPDWLLARFDSAGGTNATVTMTPVRVLGTNGSVAAVGDPVTSTAGAPSIGAVPDLSADGLTDVVLVVPGSGDGTGVDARRGVDGSPIWSSTSLTLYPGAHADPVGDVHASLPGSPAAPDIAVSSGTPTGGLGLPLPVPDPTAPPTHGTVSLLDGASGSTVWSKPGDDSYPVLMAGSPLIPATGVVQTDTADDGTRTTATVTLTTYDDNGNQIYAATYKATTPTSSGATNSTLSFLLPVGDFEPDGSTDGVVVIIVSSGSNTGVLAALIDGAEGDQLHTGAAQPLGASTTGAGDGLVVAAATPAKGVTVTVKRETDNTVLFSRHVMQTGGLGTADAVGALLHKSACADVLVSGQGSQHAASAVLSGAGGVDWVVRFAPGSTQPGTVYRPSSPPVQPTCSPVPVTG